MSEIVNFSGRSPLRLAIVTDALTVFGGAERVLEQLLLEFPEADLHALVDFSEPTQSNLILSKKARTSFIQQLPMARKYFRTYLQLWPLAIEQLDLSAYDVIITSHYAVSNGVITGPGQTHVSYTHSPMRYIWDLQLQYLRENDVHRGVKSVYARSLLHRLRLWDQAAAQRVDAFAVNSRFVGERVRKFYGRSSEVIYPPVDLSRFRLQTEKDNYFVTVSRLVPYKRIDLIIKAFNRMPDRKLVVIGTGPELKRLRKLAGPNVEVMGEQNGDVVADLVGRARAFVFAAVEDFGIAPLEAQACGTPVIGLGQGGLRETVRGLDAAAPTGVLFAEQTPEHLIDAVERLDAVYEHVSPEACRRNAMAFDNFTFRKKFREFVDRAVQRTDDFRHGHQVATIEPDPVRPVPFLALQGDTA